MVWKQRQTRWCTFVSPYPSRQTPTTYMESPLTRYSPNAMVSTPLSSLYTLSKHSSTIKFVAWSYPLKVPMMCLPSHVIIETAAAYQDKHAPMKLLYRNYHKYVCYAYYPLMEQALRLLPSLPCLEQRLNTHSGTEIDSLLSSSLIWSYVFRSISWSWIWSPREYGN